MNKLAVFFALVLVSGWTMVKLLGDSPNRIGRVLSDREIQERYVAYHAFKQSFDATVDELGKGNLRLRTACARIQGMADAYNATYLIHLPSAESGRTDSERIARNLVGHVRSWQDRKPDYRANLVRLQTELDAFVAELNSRPMMP